MDAFESFYCIHDSLASQTISLRSLVNREYCHDQGSRMATTSRGCTKAASVQPEDAISEILANPDPEPIIKLITLIRTLT